MNYLTNERTPDRFLLCVCVCIVTFALFRLFAMFDVVCCCCSSSFLLLTLVDAVCDIELACLLLLLQIVVNDAID